MFECSDGGEDWRNNFRFFAIPWKSYKGAKWYCHRGFLKVWKSMRDDIEIAVDRLLGLSPEITNIKCVGYSHGAALAVLATEDMEYLHGSTHFVYGYGFGAPRVLWGKVPQEVKDRLKNFITIRNIPDIVTHVPPKCFGFHDAGAMLEIGGKDRKYGLFKSHQQDNYLIELANI